MIMVPASIAAKERGSRPVRGQEGPRGTMTVGSGTRFSRAFQVSELLRTNSMRGTDRMGESQDSLERHQTREAG